MAITVPDSNSTNLIRNSKKTEREKYNNNFEPNKHAWFRKKSYKKDNLGRDSLIICYLTMYTLHAIRIEKF